MVKNKVVEAYCVKCKGQRQIGESEVGEKPSVQQTDNRFRLVGWCPICGTKMSRFLSASDASDFGLAKAYVSHIKAGRKGKVSVYRTGEEVGPAPDPPRPKQRKSSPRTSKGDQMVVKVNFPLKIFAIYGPRGEEKKRHDAVMKAPDQIRFNKVTYTSLSLAALVVTQNRRVNGWKFWKFVDEDGNEHSVSEIREESEVKARSVSSEPKETAVGFPPYSEEYEPVELPPREPALPKRYAAYFVNPKSARFGHIVAFILVDGKLVTGRYKPDGTLVPKTGRVLGEFDSWTEAKDEIALQAAERKLHRIKVK